MATFADYARYYNLLYRDKDYAGETTFVLGIVRLLWPCTNETYRLLYILYV